MGNSVAVITIYDLTDRENPVVEKDVKVDGAILMHEWSVTTST